MPRKPKKGESVNEYMRECVSDMKKEGVSAEKATDTCYAVWQSHKAVRNSNKRRKDTR